MFCVRAEQETGIKLADKSRWDVVSKELQRLRTAPLIPSSLALSSERLYVCGRGEDQSVPVLFLVKDPDAPAPESKPVAVSALSHPQELLKQYHGQQGDETSSSDASDVLSNVFQMRKKDIASSVQVHKPFESKDIKEVSATTSAPAPPAQSSATKAKKETAVKKGFLNQKPGKLYGDEGSSEGSGGDKGGTSDCRSA